MFRLKTTLILQNFGIRSQKFSFTTAVMGAKKERDTMEIHSRRL
jgi:hypothetical protein